MANRRFTQFYQTLHNKPVQLDCNFVVDATNGAGVNSLKGPGIQNVFMHTSGSPAAGSPNPASGYIVVQFQDNYSRYYGGYSEFRSPDSGSNIAVTAGGALLTVGQVYIISVLGTTTAANWVTLGVPIGTAAAVGVSFVAAATGAGVGSGQVRLPKAAGAGISHLEVVGDPNLMIKSTTGTIAGQTNGSYMLFQCMAPSFSGSALATHTHDLLVVGGQAASTTNDVAVYAGPILGKEQAANSTILGANSATNGGVVAASAGTPAGTSAFVAAAPAAGTWISLAFVFSNSSIIVQGE